MTQREAAIQQLKALKGKPLKAKAEHILTYYWMPIAAVIALVAIAVSLVVHLITEKSIALNMTVQNAGIVEDSSDRFIADFAKVAGIDLEEYQIVVSVNQMASDQEFAAYEAEALAAQITGKMLDILATDEETMGQWLYQDMLADLSTLLSEEQLDKYRDSLLYVDAAVLREIDEADDLEATISFPDPRKPEEMESPIPVAVCPSADSEFARIFYSGADNVALGILWNAPNIENALVFIEYIMG